MRRRCRPLPPSVYAVPGDDGSGAGPQHGLDLLAKAPDGRIVAQVTGLGLPGVDGTRGLFLIPEDPEVAAVLCDVLS